MLMEGIKVLNQVEIMDNSLTLLITAIILGVLSCVFVIGTIVSAVISNKETAVATFFIFFLFSWIGFLITKNASEKKIIPTGKYEYQVTIDDSVSMNEFYEKYEIVEVNGKIYTIKIKEVD